MQDKLYNGEPIALKGALLMLLIFSAFGIYIAPSIGLRLDHVVIYSLFLFVVFVFGFKKISIQLNLYILAIISCFAFLAVMPALVNIFSEYNYTSLTSAIAGAENYLQPIALIFISLFVFSNNSKETNKKLYIGFLKILILLLCINTFLSFVLFYIGPGKITEMIGGLGRGDALGVNVIERALSGGRTAGVFTQPIEGGVAYVIGLLGWLYLCRANKLYARKTLNNIQFYMLLVGGIMVGSKVFIVIGPVIALIYFNPFRHYRRIFNINFLITGAVFICALFFTVMNWNGVIPIDRGGVYISRLIDLPPEDVEGRKPTFSKQGTPMAESTKIEDLDYKDWLEKEYVEPENLNKLLSIYTSGRFGGASGILPPLSYVLHKSPVYGFGFGVYPGSDNALLEVMRNAGLIGIFFYSFIFMVLIYAAVRGTFIKNEDAKLLLALWLVIAFSSVGAPIFTANRISIFIWVITIYVLIQLSCKTKIIITKRSVEIIKQK